MENENKENQGSENTPEQNTSPSPKSTAENQKPITEPMESSLPKGDFFGIIKLIIIGIVIILLIFALRSCSKKSSSVEIEKIGEKTKISLSLPEKKDITKATAIFSNGYKLPLIRWEEENKWIAEVNPKEIKESQTIKVYFQPVEGKVEFIKKKIK